MVHPAQGRCLPKKPCKCCGTSREHDANCIVNLPGPFAELYPFWQQGRDNRVRLGAGGRSPVPPPQLGKEELAAYVMGSNFAAFKILAETLKTEHAATSPERSIGVDLTL